ncbi:claudin-7-like [Styela clava]|uniref:claudin-7-like n=1 Tax=Styela clava TaxID=7725 RepID=UPI00193A1B5C|nr:claudin-7-like [Styela clava]
MVNGSLQVCGYGVTIIGWLMAIITCALPSWRKNDLEGEVIESIIRTTGLWVRCTHQATGHWTCNDYDSFFLGLPVPLQGARATTCLAIAMGFIGLLLGTFGLDCTTVASDNPKMKARMVMIAGVCHVIAGVSLGIAVSWFAANVLADYQDPIASVSGIRYVYGEALFVGWISMVISVLGGAVMCCASWNSDDDDDRRPYAYNPPKPKPSSAEYI